ncbi:MAG: phosphate ABC transporter permease subunit PstC, partial [Methyloversatilis sp.]|nr:phosphate ABC transporter permease subunit PstC [Methyloversatilis sp.]
MTAHAQTMSAPPSTAPDAVSDRLRKRASRHVKERVIEFILFTAASISVLTTIAIVYILVSESLTLFEHVS